MEIIRELVPVITLVGILVNIVISRQSMKTVRDIERYKVSMSFKDRMLDKLLSVKDEIDVPFDLNAVYEVMKGQASALDYAKKELEGFHASVDKYKHVRHLFHDDERKALDDSLIELGHIEATNVGQLMDALESDSTTMPSSWKTDFMRYLHKTRDFKDLLLKTIDAAIMRETSILR